MNEVIKNHSTGDSYEFIQTDVGTSGKVSEFIITLAPKSSWAKSPMHFHPYQTETFKVLSGELNLRVGKQHMVLRPNDKKVEVDKFTLHSFWNNRNETVSFQAEIYPPVNIEKGIRLTCELSKQGKVNKRNIPYNPFHTLILMDYFDAYFSFLPWKFQKFIFGQGAKFARFLGY